MTRPEAPDHGLTFDLVTVVRELWSDDQYRHDGHIARTLLRTSDLRVVVVALNEGKTLSEHRAGVTALVQPISGRLRLRLPDEELHLTAEQLQVLGPGLVHDVFAEVESAFLLILGWPVTRPSPA